MGDMQDILDEGRRNSLGYEALRNAADRLCEALKRKGRPLKGSASQIIDGLRRESNFSMGANDTYALNDQLCQLWARRSATQDNRFADPINSCVGRFDRLHPNY